MSPTKLVYFKNNQLHENFDSLKEFLTQAQQNNQQIFTINLAGDPGSGKSYLMQALQAFVQNDLQQLSLNKIEEQQPNQKDGVEFTVISNFEIENRKICLVIYDTSCEDTESQQIKQQMINMSKKLIKISNLTLYVTAFYNFKSSDLYLLTERDIKEFQNKVTLVVNQQSEEDILNLKQNHNYLNEIFLDIFYTEKLQQMSDIDNNNSFYKFYQQIKNQIKKIDKDQKIYIEQYIQQLKEEQLELYSVDETQNAIKIDKISDLKEQFLLDEPKEQQQQLLKENNQQNYNLLSSEIENCNQLKQNKMNVNEINILDDQDQCNKLELQKPESLFHINKGDDNLFQIQLNQNFITKLSRMPKYKKCTVFSFIGNQGSGKSTIADAFLHLINNNVKQRVFGQNNPSPENNQTQYFIHETENQVYILIDFINSFETFPINNQDQELNQFLTSYFMQCIANLISDHSFFVKSYIRLTQSEINYINVLRSLENCLNEQQTNCKKQTLLFNKLNQNEKQQVQNNNNQINELIFENFQKISSICHYSSQNIDKDNFLLSLMNQQFGDDIKAIFEQKNNCSDNITFCDEFPKKLQEIVDKCNNKGRAIFYKIKNSNINRYQEDIYHNFEDSIIYEFNNKKNQIFLQFSQTLLTIFNNQLKFKIENSIRNDIHLKLIGIYQQLYQRSKFNQQIKQFNINQLKFEFEPKFENLLQQNRKWDYYLKKMQNYCSKVAFNQSNLFGLINKKMIVNKNNLSIYQKEFSEFQKEINLFTFSQNYMSLNEIQKIQVYLVFTLSALEFYYAQNNKDKNDIKELEEFLIPYNEQFKDLDSSIFQKSEQLQNLSFDKIKKYIYEYDNISKRNDIKDHNNQQTKCNSTKENKQKYCNSNELNIFINKKQSDKQYNFTNDYKDINITVLDQHKDQNISEQDILATLAVVLRYKKEYLIQKVYIPELNKALQKEKIYIIDYLEDMSTFKEQISNLVNQWY